MKSTANSTRAGRIFGGLALLALAVLLLSYPLAWGLTRNAQLLQLALPTDAAAATLFGEEGSQAATPLGSPQRYINLNDPAAFLEGQGQDGARLVSEPYLKANGIYPIQEKTVWFFHLVTAVVAGLAALLFGALWWFGRRRSSRARPT